MGLRDGLEVVASAAGGLTSMTGPSEGLLEVDLSVDLGHGLVLGNPIMAASGVFGYGVEYCDALDVNLLGAICTRGTTLRPRLGNASPRAIETAAGLLNAVGLQNPGVNAVLERYGDRWSTWDVPVIVNVAGESVDDYAELARRLDGHPGVAGIEINLSCPNSDAGGVQFALDAAAAAAVVAAMRAITELPLLAKLSPAAADPRTTARALVEAGVDAITAVNTMPALAVDRLGRRPFLGNVYGGLSGPALKPIALRVVFEVAQSVKIPVVAAGGVATLDDVLDYLMAGASAVQVGTAAFADPQLPVRLVEELAAWIQSNGHGSHRDIVGSALPSRRQKSSVKGAEYRP
jgi:dihydroorotate dehydrogenase (NAD+) catalytic subunit